MVGGKCEVTNKGEEQPGREAHGEKMGEFEIILNTKHRRACSMPRMGNRGLFPSQKINSTARRFDEAGSCGGLWVWVCVCVYARFWYR